MPKICYKLILLIFFLNFDLAKGGGGGASAPLALPGCALVPYTFITTVFTVIAWGREFESQADQILHSVANGYASSCVALALWREDGHRKAVGCSVRQQNQLVCCYTV